MYKLKDAHFRIFSCILYTSQLVFRAYFPVSDMIGLVNCKLYSYLIIIAIKCIFSLCFHSLILLFCQVSNINHSCRKIYILILVCILLEYSSRFFSFCSIFNIFPIYIYIYIIHFLYILNVVNCQYKRMFFYL